MRTALKDKSIITEHFPWVNQKAPRQRFFPLQETNILLRSDPVTQGGGRALSTRAKVKVLLNTSQPEIKNVEFLFKQQMDMGMRPLLGEYLLAEKLITPLQLEVALREQKRHPDFLWRSLGQSAMH